MEPLHAPGNAMIYVLEGHGLKHAVEEMLLHLTPAELPVQGDAAPETGDYCISRLPGCGRRGPGGGGGPAGRRDPHRVRTKPVAGLDALGEKRAKTEIVKLAVFDAIVPACRKSRNGAA